MAPLLFILAPIAMVALAAYTLLHAYRHHLLLNGAYAALNIVLLSYAIVAFIGIRNTMTDIWVHSKSFLYQPAMPRRRRWFRRRAPQPPAPLPDWRVVLQYGSADPSHWPKSPITELASSGANGSAAAHGHHQFRTVFQPVQDLASGEIVGFEALTRFEDGVRPQHRLADAVAAGNASALEAALAEAALAAAAELPEQAWLGIKISPRALGGAPGLRDALARSKRPIVVEVTEPATLDGSDELMRWRADLPGGVRFAIDHAGLGHKSLSMLSTLQPEFVKLDRGALVGIADDPVLHVQVAGLVQMADSSGCRVIATGIETDAALAVLRDIGVHCGQGYLLGQPGEAVGV